MFSINETKADMGLAGMFIRGVAFTGMAKYCCWLEEVPAREPIGGTKKHVPGGTMTFDGIAHMGTNPCANGIVACWILSTVVMLGFVVVAVADIGARPTESETPSFSSACELFVDRFCFFLSGGSSGSGLLLADGVVGILRVPLTDMAMAGTVPVPVAAMIAGSACSRSHRMVSPSDL